MPLLLQMRPLVPEAEYGSIHVDGGTGVSAPCVSVCGLCAAWSDKEILSNVSFELDMV